MPQIVADRDVVDIVVRVALDPRRGTDVVDVPVANEREREMFARDIAGRLGPFGFVPVRANLNLTDELRHRIAHRHLVLLAFAPAEKRATLEWLRTLSSVSPRAHLVVSFTARRGAASMGKEPSDSLPASAPPRQRRGDRAVARLFERAERFSRRGRHAQAERWYRAALESARRRADESGQTAACRQIVQHLLRRDEWEAACRLTRSVLLTLRDVTPRGEVAALLGGILIAQAELGEADALLSSIRSELAVANLQSSASLNEVFAELRFWQGRLEEAAAATSPHATTVRHAMVVGAIAFLRRDGAELNRCAAAASRVAPPYSTFCHRLLSMAHAALTGEAEQVRALFAILERLSRRLGCPRLVRLGRAFAVEAHVVAGLSAPVADMARAQPATQAMPRLDRLFLEWQRAAALRDHAGQRSSALQLARAGVRVVETWRWGCRDMHLIHAIPILLQVVQDAEDDLATLVAACSWVRKEGGADAVAFLDPDRAVVSGDGWTAADATGSPDPPDDQSRVSEFPGGAVLIVRGVRYAGTMTGVVAVRGSSDRREVLIEAANTAAALCGPALRARIDLIKTMRVSPALAAEILGRSPAIVALREAAARAAVTPFPVLVEGESGTGKELVARAIHRLSPRRDRRFVAVNCAALSDELVETELFGHTRGAFTGAVGPRTGLFEDAHGGTLFLDEVGELSPRAQAKLLRVLQEREVRRVGENASRSVDVRVVAATNRPLSDAVRRASFRDDLLFRLAVVRLRVPPLRDRVEDVPLLAQACWRSLAIQAGKRAMLGPDALAQLCRHSWPGNVRELQNAMAALLVVAPERGRVAARHVGQVLSASTGEGQVPSLPLHRTRANFERTAVAGALARHGGRRTPAARELGMTRQGLTKAIKRLGLDDGPETGVA